jgi:hypothetical protein
MCGAVCMQKMIAFSSRTVACEQGNEVQTIYVGLARSVCYGEIIYNLAILSCRSFINLPKLGDKSLANSIGELTGL